MGLSLKAKLLCSNLFIPVEKLRRRWSKIAVAVPVLPEVGTGRSLAVAADSPAVGEDSLAGEDTEP